MNLLNDAFDDFVDECLLEDDSLCHYESKDLDQVIQSLVSINPKEWQVYEELAA